MPNSSLSPILRISCHCACRCSTCPVPDIPARSIQSCFALPGPFAHALLLALSRLSHPVLIYIVPVCFALTQQQLVPVVPEGVGSQLDMVSKSVLLVCLSLTVFAFVSVSMCLLLFPFRTRLLDRLTVLRYLISFHFLFSLVSVLESSGKSNPHFLCYAFHLFQLCSQAKLGLLLLVISRSHARLAQLFRPAGTPVCTSLSHRSCDARTWLFRHRSSTQGIALHLQFLIKKILF